MNNEQKKEKIYKEPNLNRYETDVEGVSLKKLEAGLWWIKNKKKFKNILIAILLAISIFGWGYYIYGWGYYFLIGLGEDRQLARQILQSGLIPHNYLLAKAPKDLIFSQAGIIENNGKYDLYFSVRNPNAKHWKKFSYCFLIEGEKNICGESFILPEEKKYILSLSQDLKSRPANIKFETSKSEWKKINAHEIANWEKYKKEHLNIAIKDVIFTAGAESDLSEKISLNTLNFSAENNSAYGYYEAPFSIVLSRNNQIIALSEYVVSDFASLEKRQIKITWPGSMGKADNIDISPNINILEKSNYLPRN